MTKSATVSASHSASASLTGYLFQARYALLRGLEEGRRHPGHALSVEKLDDVAFEDDGRPVELIQTKHHVTGSDVSDSSVDVWKTLNIWVKRLAEYPTDVANTRLVFLTTSEAVSDTALSMLRRAGDGRNEVRAKEVLLSVAKTSRNQATAAAREAFLSLTDSARRVLIGNMWVFDRAPNIIDVREEIETVLHYSAPPEQVGALTDHLEGWWFNRIVVAMTDENFTTIELSSIQNKVAELRERFRLGKLPLDDTIEATTDVGQLAADDRTFVRQMKLVRVSEEEVIATVQDYYRAYEQRSRWAREHLFLDGEADRYDRSLRDAWHRRFLACTADLSDSCDNTSREAEGRRVFRWAREYQKPLRNRDEIWLSSGSFQMLADEVRIGWHPDYATLLNSSKEEG